jgi:hypothetical protein
MRCNMCGLPTLPHKTICPLCHGQNEIHKFVGPHVDKTGKLSRSNTMAPSSALKPEYQPALKNPRTNNSCDASNLSRQRTYHAGSNINSNHNSNAPASKKNITCEICNNFKCETQALLTRHIDTVHNRQRLYECNHCKTTFGLKANLKKHVRSVHEKQKPFSCDHCPAKFTQRTSLNRHLATKHNINVNPTNAPPANRPPAANQYESSGSRDRRPPAPPRSSR